MDHFKNDEANVQTSAISVSALGGISEGKITPLQVAREVVEKGLQENSPLARALSSWCAFYVHGKGVGFDVSTGITQQVNQICFEIKTLSSNNAVTRHSIQLAGG
jgi:hypothetical protein